jgi:predicted negative regulator of RcsB-dependent stress response
MAARFRRKDLKRPDAFVSTSQLAFEWAITHQRNLLIGVSAVVGVLVAIAALGSLQTARRRQANEELAIALRPLQAENYPDAATQLRTVADAWRSTPTGQVARLYAAGAQLAAGNPDIAAADLRLALDEPAAADYLAQQAALNLGFALEIKNDLAGAADQYGRAAKEPGPYRSLALLREARVQDKLGKRDRAEEAYEAFIRDFPSAPEVPLAEARLAAK